MSGGEYSGIGDVLHAQEFACRVGSFNPFTDNYKQQTENWNKYASYKKTNYVKESSQMFLASVSYNFSFGRKFKAGQRRVNNSDNDSGVMSTGK